MTSSCSDVFDNSPRLQEFLSYIVNESLAGRGDTIKGKTISADVYGADLSSDASEKNLVRVEAGRLRRALSAYYAEAGQNDPIRIYVDTGGYNPRFERISPTSTTDERTEADPSRIPFKRIACAAFVLLVVAVGSAAVFSVAITDNLIPPAPYWTSNNRCRHNKPGT